MFGFNAQGMHIDLESSGTEVAFFVTLYVACFHAKPNHCQDQQLVRQKTRSLKIPVFTRVVETIFANLMMTPSTGLPHVCADSVV